MESITEEQRYKREQEDFVSNHGGSSAREVLLAISPNICGVILTATIIGLLDKKPDRIIQTCIEFVVNVFPCVLCFTILSNYTMTICMTMLTIAGVNFYIILTRSSREPRQCPQNLTNKRPFVTNFRALTNIITAICILAVDFQIFPRKYAKTEVYGYSLMDSGVGFFILANALVAPEARDFAERPKWSLRQKFSANAKVCTKNSAFLLILGFGRFLAIEFSGYQRHVTEYGIHWNFFVTLAFVRIFTSTISSAISSRYSLIVGIWMIGMHEYALSTKGLKEWVLGDAPRTDFVSANREGLVSIPGYVGLYLIGIAIGRLIHTSYHNEKPSSLKSKKNQMKINFFGKEIEIEYSKSMILCVKLSLIAVQCCAVTLFCDFNFGVSRRLANSGYCAWIVTFGVSVLTLLLFVEIMTDILNSVGGKPKSGRNFNKKDPKSRVKFVESMMNRQVVDESINKSPEIFEAVNYNGLAFFLISNLFTGVINMSTKTLYVEAFQAIQILVLYIAVVIFFAICLFRTHIQLKLK